MQHTHGPCTYLSVTLVLGNSSFDHFSDLLKAPIGDNGHDVSMVENKSTTREWGWKRWRLAEADSIPSISHAKRRRCVWCDLVHTCVRRLKSRELLEMYNHACRMCNISLIQDAQSSMAKSRWRSKARKNGALPLWNAAWPKKTRHAPSRHFRNPRSMVERLWHPFS